MLILFGNKKEYSQYIDSVNNGAGKIKEDTPEKIKKEMLEIDKAFYGSNAHHIYEA